MCWDECICMCACVASVAGTAGVYLGGVRECPPFELFSSPLEFPDIKNF